MACDLAANLHEIQRFFAGPLFPLSRRVVSAERKAESISRAREIFWYFTSKTGILARIFLAVESELIRDTLFVTLLQLLQLLQFSKRVFQPQKLVLYIIYIIIYIIYRYKISLFTNRFWNCNNCNTVTHVHFPLKSTAKIWRIQILFVSLHHIRSRPRNRPVNHYWTKI